MGYTPSAWKLARVVFIPKAGRTSYTKAKDFRPISLTSFLLKTLEKLVDAYLRETTLWRHPLHKNQHAYRSGYSTETALHQTVAFIKEQLERKGYAVGAFLDIEGAFNNTPQEVVCEEAARRGVPMKLVEWIRGMLGRRVMTLLGTAKVCGWVERGCPQGGVLSPLLWCLVADGLLKALDDRGFTVQGYADDVAILVRGPFLETLLELMQGALEVVEELCQRTGLAVNPLKTGLTVFTPKYKVGIIVGSTLGGVRLVPTKSVKYLGVILDKKLLWKEHLRNRCKSLCQYFWMCRRTFGQTWGLKPSMIHWIYTAILRPRLTYAAVVWWTRVQKKNSQICAGACQGSDFERGPGCYGYDTSGGDGRNVRHQTISSGGGGCGSSGDIPSKMRTKMEEGSPAYEAAGRRSVGSDIRDATGQNTYYSGL
nr:PREDICTED: RNA-directed DNA polymerase from mobile element jockey-like [Linepithema humile]